MKTQKSLINDVVNLAYPIGYILIVDCEITSDVMRIGVWDLLRITYDPQDQKELKIYQRIA